MTTTGAAGVTTGVTVPLAPEPVLGAVVPPAGRGALARGVTSARRRAGAGPSRPPVLELVSVRRPTLMREPVGPSTGSTSTVRPPDAARRV